jgi:two-component system response regulator DesR
MRGAVGDVIRVGIAEDAELMLDAVRFLLEQQRDLNVVAVARTGKEALAIAADGRLDVLVLDLALPDLEGSEVLRRLRGRKTSPDVVVCSAHADEETRRHALEGGAAAFVVKDRVCDELPDVIRDAAARGRRRAG